MVGSVPDIFHIICLLCNNACLYLVATTCILYHQLMMMMGSISTNFLKNITLSLFCFFFFMNTRHTLFFNYSHLNINVTQPFFPIFFPAVILLKNCVLQSFSFATLKGFNYTRFYSARGDKVVLQEPSFLSTQLRAYLDM